MERNNGFLSSVNNNGHLGGEVEATMMRAWTRVQLVQELVSLFLYALERLIVINDTLLFMISFYRYSI